MIHDAKHYFDYMQRHADALVAIRRDIHQHPELGFEEHRTSELVAQHLERWGYRVERGIAGTGVVGQLVCGDGPHRLGLRADMDALPIDEKLASRMPACMQASCMPVGTTATRPCCWVPLNIWQKPAISTAR